MGFNMRSWSNPINLDANNLNRLEQGIKNSYASLEIIGEEVSNLQNKYLDLTSKMSDLTKIDSSTLDKLNALLTNEELASILSTSNNLLTKTEQSLTVKELQQVYKNLNLDSFLKLTSIKVNGVDIVDGSEVNIILPKVDTSLNINSTNAISNKAVANALKNINLDGKIPSSLADLTQDDLHQTVSALEKSKWNSILDNLVVEETDPTVPDWAKSPTKPLYEYSELLNKPFIPSDTSELSNGAKFVTEQVSQTYIAKQLEDFNTSTITPINNEITNLKTIDTQIINTLNTKADSSHTHDTVYSKLNHNHDTVYSKLDHTHDNYVTLDTEQTVSGKKKMPNAMFPSETGSTDYRYPLTVPMATSTAKRYLLGSAGIGSNNRWTNLHTSVYMENGKLYSNNTEVSVSGHTHTRSNITDLYIGGNNTSEGIHYWKIAQLKTTSAVGTGWSIASLLVSGVGNFGSPILGTYIITMGTRANAAMQVTELAPPQGIGNCAFGYIVTSTSVDFYIKTTSYNFPIKIIELNNSNTIAVGNLATSTTDPGLTYVPIIKKADTSHTHSYSAIYTGTSATQTSNTTLSNLRIGYAGGSLYIWNS